MNTRNGTAAYWESSLENLAAILTEAVYPVVLRHGVRTSWVDLELDVWNVLRENVKEWGRKPAAKGE